MKSCLNYLKYGSTISFADSSAITIMKKLDIHEIFSFNSDFDRVDDIVRIH